MNLQSISQKRIKEDLYDYLKSLDNWEEIQEKIEASTLDILLNLIASFGTYEIFKYKSWQKENYIEDASLEESVFRLAKLLGYRINRYKSPVVKVKLDSEQTMTFYTGQVLGSYENYDIIYFGKTKKFENGDEFYLHIGKYNELFMKIKTDFLTINLKPLMLKSIDNNQIKLFINNVEKPLSINVEDYVVFNSAVDYSIDKFSTKIFVFDKQNFYGIQGINIGDGIAIKYIETDGYNENIKLQKLVLEDFLIPLEISSLGTLGEDVEKTRFLAPLYYSTLRRMVTKKDHEYVINAHPYIKDCAVKMDKSKPYISSLSLVEPYNQIYTVNLNGNEYSYEGNGELQDALNGLSNLLNSDKNYNSYIENDKIILKQSNLELCDINISVSDNIVLETKQEYYKRKCCTIFAYYIKYNTTDEPIILSPEEQVELSEYINLYKLMGTSVILIPASKEEYEIKLKVSLNNYDFQSKVIEEINKIIDSYELKLEKSFYYGELLSKIAQITIFHNDNYFSPIDYVLPNQKTFDLEGKVDTYYKFNREIEFIETDKNNG